MLRNESRYSTQEVRKLVTFAVGEIDLRHVCVKVKNSNRQAFSGMAYDHIPRLAVVPASAKQLVTVRIGGQVKFPLLGHRYLGKSDRFPTYDIHNWQEALVVCTAHEALHIEQFREGLRCSELRAERYAVRKLNEWREVRDGQITA